MTVLRTDRLLLRPLEQADAEAYLGVRYHPDVAKWLLPPDREPIEAARATIKRFAVSWRERRYAPWGVFLDGQLIGQGGLNYVPEFDGTEVLWALHPDAWGKGYATEVARVALGYGFDNLGLDLIFAITKPDNLASQAVMKRLGLVHTKNVIYRGFDTVWFETARPRTSQRESSAPR